MKNAMLSIMAWAQNTAAAWKAALVEGEEGAIDNSLLLTILIVVGIAALVLWIVFNYGVHQK